MQPTELLTRARPWTGQVAPIDDPARSWTAATLRSADVTFTFDAAMNAEVAAAMAHVRANGLDLDCVEQEDIRLPRFARAIAGLRRRLDEGAGVVIIAGIDLGPYSEAESRIIAWGIGNYLGRPIRQGITQDRRLFSVTDGGSGYGDPTRIGATPRESAAHTDNGCLEPRPPCYIGLLCVHDAMAGGDSRVLSAVTVHNEFWRQRPDLLGLLYQPFHFKPPVLHTWPGGPQTIVKPIFEVAAGELRIHYARVMVEPGMAIAGTPLEPRQREALDLLDAILARDDLALTHHLAPGEFLVINNQATIHGRGAFQDGGPDRKRLLQRIWMWRRHLGAGLDPAALDAAELA